MLTFVFPITLLAALALAPQIQEPIRLDTPTNSASAENATTVLTLDTPVEGVSSPVISSVDGKLIVTANGESNLADLVEAYANLVGIRILVGTRSEDALESMPFKMFGAPNGLTTKGLTPFVEGVLRDSGFVLYANGGQQSFTVFHIDTGRSRSISWLRVSSDNLTMLRQHPALVMETVFVLKHADSRRASSSLRSVFSDPPYRSIIGVDESGALVLRGTGVELANAIEMLAAIDAAAARATNPPAEAHLVQPQAKGAMPGKGLLVNTTARPKLVTRIFQIEGDTSRISKTAEGLTRGRYNAASKGLVWSTAEGSTEHWPAPRFWTDRNINRILVQAPERDFPGIEADLKTALKLHRKDS